MNAADMVGRHQVFRIPPGVVFVAYQGDVSTDEAHRMSELLAVAAAHQDRRFIVDLRGLGNVPPDVRRAMISERRRPVGSEVITVEVAFVGARLRAKVLMTAMVTAAASAHEGLRIQIQFFDALDQAMKWASTA